MKMSRLFYIFDIESKNFSGAFIHWPPSLQLSWIRFCAFYALPNTQKMHTIWMRQRMWKTLVRTGSPTLKKNNLYENKNTLTLTWCGLRQMLLASR